MPNTKKQTHQSELLGKISCLRGSIQALEIFMNSCNNKLIFNYLNALKDNIKETEFEVLNIDQYSLIQKSLLNIARQEIENAYIISNNASLKLSSLIKEA